MHNKTILVTGGLGYIGSHTVVELQNEGFEVIIVDNLSNSSLEVLDGIERITGKRPTFEQFDLRGKQKVQKFFRTYDFVGTIHFAASKAVKESVENPLLYYENNIGTLVNLLQELIKQDSVNLIFSSSRTVYGRLDNEPMSENLTFRPAESPYGNTKKIGEDILKDTCQVNDNLSVISLRYFNPVGAHSSAMIGELPLGEPQNLVPYITQTAMGIHKGLKVFGGDWPTKDGTCVRDYIHVVDVAKAHMIALKRLLERKNESNFEYFNLGSGKGNTVLEVIDSFERVSGRKLNYQIVGRRPGDDAIAYADTDKANKILGWKAESTLDEAIKSAWDWEQNIRS